MSNSYRLHLGISPISAAEAERALQALQRAWCMPSWIRHTLIGTQVLLLEMGHEAPLKLDESPDWFAERISAAIWQETGRFVRISIEMTCQEATDGQIFIFDEADYWRIMQSFRLSSAR